MQQLATREGVAGTTTKVKVYTLTDVHLSPVAFTILAYYCYGTISRSTHAERPCRIGTSYSTG